MKEQFILRAGAVSYSMALIRSLVQRILASAILSWLLNEQEADFPTDLWRHWRPDHDVSGGGGLSHHKHNDTHNKKLEKCVGSQLGLRRDDTDI